MEREKIEIEFLGDEKIIDKNAFEKAIYLETYYNKLNKIKISGQYNKEYLIATCFDYLNEKRILVDENFLIICFQFNYVIIDMKTDKVIQDIDPEVYGLFEIHKFKSGYFIYGEGANIFLSKDFDMVWKLWCGDIFVNAIVSNELEIFDDYITVFDWYGIKHFYNEKGEFKTEYYPQFNMNKNEAH